MTDLKHHHSLSHRLAWAAALLVAALSAWASPAWATPAQPAGVTAAAPLLTPGEGFDASTVPPTIDLAALDPSAAVAIARWDVVPFQTVGPGFEIGVVAFHINGIDRVEFSANGGPWTAVDRPTLNPRTGVTEYWVRLGEVEAGGKPIEVRAVAYPTNGFPRLLAGPLARGVSNGEYSLQLFTAPSAPPQPVLVDSDEALARAFASAPDGAEIHLAAGEYACTQLIRSSDDQHWLTVRPQPGLERGSVVIRPDRRQNIRIDASRVRWVDISFDHSRVQRLLTPRGALQWFDRCEWFDSNGWDAPHDLTLPFIHPMTVVFQTDNLIRDTIYAAVNHHLVRGCKLLRISGDAFINNGSVLACEVDTLDGSIRKHHTDLFQFWAPKDSRLLENRIVFDIKATNVWAQQFFMRTGGGAVFRDFAFVDITVQSPRNKGRALFKSQLYCDHEHVIFRNLRTELDMVLRTPGNALENEGYRATHVLFDQCSFPARTLATLTTSRPTGIELRDCRATQFTGP